jgi:pimeloyl-ACP methyl ester carboxylesterase
MRPQQSEPHHFDICKTIAIDGNRLAYTAVGDPAAPPIIFLHGWMSHRGVWQATVDSLQDTFYCVAIDLLGFGDSEKPKDTDYSIEAQARRVLAVADELGLEHFSLIGHSMGAQISMDIAAVLAPDRVDKLVSVDGIVSGQVSRPVKWLAYPLVWLGYKVPFLYPVARWLIKLRPGARLYFNNWFHDMNCLRFDEWAIDRNMAMQPGIQNSAYPTGKAIRSLDLEPYLENIRAKLLAIYGMQDEVVLSTDAYLLQEHISNSCLMLIDNCGHFPMYERPRCFVTTVRSFLSN